MKKLIVRFLALLSFCFLLLVVFLINPEFAYSHSTTYKNITIYHNEPLDENLKTIVDLSLNTIKTTSIYNKRFKSELCLNDGSYYPKIVKTLLGDDVFTAFSNKVVVLGNSSKEFNRFIKWNKSMKYSQFLSHGLMHNLQFLHHGMLDANPLGRHPKWKWEGYVEYSINGKLVELEDLVHKITNITTSDFEWIELPEDNGTIKLHIKYLAMTKYCHEVLKWDYEKFMSDEASEAEIFSSLLNWIEME